MGHPASIGEPVVLRRGHDAEAGGAEREFDDGAGRVQFAVGVQRAGSGAFDGEVRAAEMKDAGVTVDGAVEETREKRSGVGERWTWNRGEIEQAIVGAGTGGDEGVVAVLVAVGDGEGEGGDLVARVGGGDDEVFWLPASEGGGAGAQVAHKAARGEGVEFLGDVGFEAEAGDSEERMVVSEAGIDEAGSPRF